MPGFVAIAHGIAGITGFSLVLRMVLREPGFGLAKIGTVILMGAISLGCVNGVYHLRRRRHRSGFIVSHAVVAIAGLITLQNSDLGKAASEPPRAIPRDAGDAGAPAIASSASTDAGIETTAARVPGATSTAAPAASAGPDVGWAWTDREIVFPDNSATMANDANDALDRVAQDLTRDPRVRLIEIQGHADERGTKAYNMSLTRMRARAVRDALIARGVAAGRLRTAAYGADCPLDNGHAESSWKRNRRVAFLIVDSGAQHFQGPTCGHDDRMP